MPPMRRLFSCVKTAADNLKSEIYKNLLTNDRKPVIIIIYFFTK